MKRNVVAVTLLALCFTLTGCFGIEEKILIHKDGSGTLSYTIDATEMMKQIMNFAAQLDKSIKSDTTQAEKQVEEEPAENNEQRTKAVNNLRKDFTFNKDGRVTAIQGISNYAEFIDTTNGKLVFGLSFDFKNVSSLNKALGNMFSGDDGDTKKSKNLPPAIYAFKDGVLTREVQADKIKSLAGAGKEQKDLEKTMKELENNPMVKDMMKGFKYVVIVESDAAIQSAVAPGANIDKKGKSVVIDYQLLEKGKEITKSKMKSTVKVY